MNKLKGVLVVLSDFAHHRQRGAAETESPRVKAISLKTEGLGFPSHPT